MSNDSEITLLLKAASDGDSQAAAELLPLVYQQLRNLAAARMKKVPPGQTLQPTALVHEAYLRISSKEDSSFANRDHFFFAAARAMRDILVEQARAKASLKRGGDRKRVGTDNLVIAINAPAADMIALSEALDQLEREFPRKHELVMLRFFAGLTEPEAAEVLKIDPSTARRDWRFVRGWLYNQLKDPETVFGLNGEEEAP